MNKRLLNKKDTLRKIHDDRLSHPKNDIDRLCAIVCRHYDIAGNLLFGRCRLHHVSRARNLLAAMLHQLGYPTYQIMESLGMTLTSCILSRRKAGYWITQPSHAWRLSLILKDIAEEMPHLMIFENDSEQGVAGR